MLLLILRVCLPCKLIRTASGNVLFHIPEACETLTLVHQRIEPFLVHVEHRNIAQIIKLQRAES